MIYGASRTETDVSHRNRAIGFLPVEAREIRDVDKSSPLGIECKKANDWDDKWTYEIPVVRHGASTSPFSSSGLCPRHIGPEPGRRSPSGVRR